MRKEKDDVIHLGLLKVLPALCRGEGRAGRGEHDTQAARDVQDLMQVVIDADPRLGNGAGRGSRHRRLGGNGHAREDQADPMGLHRA